MEAKARERVCGEAEVAMGGGLVAVELVVGGAGEASGKGAPVSRH